VAQSNNIHIRYNLFTNNASQDDLKVYNSDQIYFQHNVSGPNELQPVNFWVTDGQPHSSFYVTDNIFSNWRRNAVEGGSLVGFAPCSPLTDYHFDRNMFTVVAGADNLPGGGEHLALYGCSSQNANNTVWGNTFAVTGGISDWAIEISIGNTTIEQNVMNNTLSDIQISACPGCVIVNNSFNNYSDQYSDTPFAPDGGYDGTEWIGTNLWNGTPVVGWPASATYGPAPPVYKPSTPD
jgi:hypothetical protein